MNLKNLKKDLVTPRVGVWIETLLLSLLWVVVTVTPRVGVWIETRAPISSDCPSMSLPAWECGLKLFQRYFRSPRASVTPRVGVWIET